MVWKENGKFGIHTGRTLRNSSTSLGKADCGFLIKTVRNQNINFTDEQVRGCLKRFQIGDGLDEDSVVKESRDDRHWRFGGGGGYLDYRVLYSLGKRKRWLMTTVLREKIPEDYDSGNEYKVILVERLSVHGSSWYCSSPRLRRGDCRAVLEGEEARKPKRRKFAHVGDLRSKSNDACKTEILYEVNQTESSSCWPSYLQHDLRDFREQNKARCKKKGVKNKTRLWGEFSNYDLNKTPYQILRERNLDYGPETDHSKDKLVSSSDKQEHFSRLDKCDFDLGKYISEALAGTSAKTDNKNRKKNGKTSVLKETELKAVNPASSQLVKYHEKGSAVHVNCVDVLDGIHANPGIGTTNVGHPGVPVTTASVPQNRSFSVDVDITNDKLDRQALHMQFGEMYIEGESAPRRFSIGVSDPSTKFVFTCHPYSTKTTDERAIRVTVAVVSDALPSQQSQHCKEFLENFFGILECESKVLEEPLPADKSSLDYSPNSNNNQLDRVAVMPFDLLCDINRWSYRALTVSLALPDILSNNALFPAQPATGDGESKTTIIPDTVVCEVCCCEFYHDTRDDTRTFAFPCTALKACLHWFCNDCWKGYLSAQLQQGKIFVKCPAYDCNTIVDDVTLMGLLPGMFRKLLTMRQEKAVEMSSKWKWCPRNKCNLVVKAASHKGFKGKEDKTASLPVHCSCGHTWCFSCQEEPHWPASCNEAAFFHSQTETYEEIVKTKSGGITSVNVKRCPHCSYPIEKNQGCPHMVCGMCEGEFCWTCLGPWNDKHWSADCDQKFKEEEEVELVNDIGSTRFNANLRVAIVNRMARAGPMLYKKYSAVKRLEEALHFHEVFNSHCPPVKRSTPSSNNLLLSLYNSHHLPKYLKLSADFKFLAHFVVEGVSILMAVSKTKRRHNELKRLVSTLLFVAERLEHLADKRKLCSQSDKVHFEMLLKAGKHCIECVRRVCTNIHHP
ncbi:uncharacterized protein LOC111329056 isoform X1 [Stylophora pistillata]|uniref:uncharacterized protein LOC111329056 isoform X1 n=1 Tax=Stylophora pistillata TaxID=50429 RepID=UPI000C04FE5D|nr:uncharacterized protein LOC111329056 isoform X1 [Stylophora pistillata]